MSSRSQRLDPEHPSDHLVQFYGGNHGTLARDVSQFLSEGWRLGEGLLVVATAPHRELLTKQLRKDGVDPVEAVREGRLAWLGAEATLAGIVLDGEPSPERFRQFIGGAVQALLAHPGTTRVRAFGELAVLEPIEVPARLHCSGCGTDWDLESRSFRCVACGGGDVVVVAGEEFEVESIDVEEDPCMSKR